MVIAPLFLLENWLEKDGKEMADLLMEVLVLGQHLVRDPPAVAPQQPYAADPSR
jgi:hypothetical protein